MTLHLCPEFGYIFNDNWAAGVLLGHEREREGDGNIKRTANAFKFSPFARYYYYHKGPFNLYLDGGFGLNFGNTKNSLTNTTTNFNGFEVGVRPGACVDLVEGLCLCLRFGFVGYRDQYFMGEEPGLSDNDFGIRFAPEDLMIGLELEF